MSVEYLPDGVEVEHFQQAPADRGESVRNQVGEVVGQLSVSHQLVDVTDQQQSVSGGKLSSMPLGRHPGSLPFRPASGAVRGRSRE